MYEILDVSMDFIIVVSKVAILLLCFWFGIKVFIFMLDERLF